jgi:regulator of cell morphogenesis and NO signaling
MQTLQTFNGTISEIVRKDYRTADVFKKHGINFCCGGQVSLQEVCLAKNIDYKIVEEDLSAVTRNIHFPNALQFSEWKIDFLIDYIINVHHAYVNIAAAPLQASLVSFADHHKNKKPFEELLILFKKITGSLMAHNQQEEEIIFPYVRQIESTHRRKEIYGNLFVRTLRKPLSNMEQEHTSLTTMMEEMQTLTDNYNFSEKACTSHQVIYHKLREFHEDFLQHKYLENNILFPKAIGLEKELLQL